MYSFSDCIFSPPPPPSFPVAGKHCAHKISPEFGWTFWLSGEKWRQQQSFALHWRPPPSPQGYSPQRSLHSCAILYHKPVSAFLASPLTESGTEDHDILKTSQRSLTQQWCRQLHTASCSGAGSCIQSSEESLVSVTGRSTPCLLLMIDRVCESHSHQSQHCIWDTCAAASRSACVDTRGRRHGSTWPAQRLCGSLCTKGMSTAPGGHRKMQSFWKLLRSDRNQTRHVIHFQCSKNLFDKASVSILHAHASSEPWIIKTFPEIGASPSAP